MLTTPVDKPVFIYALCDVAGSVRYIGKSVNPQRRMYSHLYPRGIERTHKARWLKKMLPAQPTMEILEVATEATWKQAEKDWIAICRLGFLPLTNISDGGDGAAFKKSPEAVAKTAAAHRGMKRSLLTRQRISEARKGSHRTAEQIESHRLKMIGQKRTEEQKARMRGRVVTDKQRLAASISASRKRSKNPSSQYLGVSFNSRLKKWVAQTSVKGVKFYFGVFRDEKDAAKAFDAGIKSLGLVRKENFNDMEVDCRISDQGPRGPTP